VGSLVPCDGLEAYRRLAIDSDESVPVIGSDQGDGMLASRLGRRHAGRWSSDDILIADRDAYLPFARAFADWTGRELHVAEDPLPLVRRLSPASATIVAAPDFFTYMRLEAIAGSSAAIGILTARSATTMSRRVALAAFGTQAPPTPVAILDPALDHTDRYAEQRVEALCMAVHGNSIDLDLPGGILCGRGRQAASAMEYPCSYRNGCRRNPEGKATMLDVATLNADVLFVESCNAVALTDGLFTEDASIALNAMDQPVTSLIATYKLIRSSEGVLPIMAAGLLEAGFRLGEVASTINRVQAAVVGDCPSFVLLGDPCTRLNRPTPPATVPINVSQSASPVSINIPVGDSSEPLVVASLNGPRNLAGASVMADGPTNGDGDGGLVVVLPDVLDRTATIYAVRPADAPSGIVRVVLGSDKAEDTRRVLDIARSGIATLESIRSGVAQFPDPTDATLSCLADLGDLVHTAKRVTGQAEAFMYSNLTNTARIGQPHVDATDLVLAYCALGRRLTLSFQAWGLSSHLARTYMHAIVPTGRERSAGPCDRCGSPTFELEYRHRSVYGVHRRLAHCARCGIRSDTPAEPEARIQIDVPTVVTPGVTPIQVTVTNPYPFAVECSVAGFVSHVGAESGATVREGSPVVIPADVAGNTTLFVEVGDDAQPGVYEFAAVGSSILDLRIAARPLKIQARGD
jgi:hypothetical protein